MPEVKSRLAGFIARALLLLLAGIPDFRFIEYLTFNRVEVRWQYVSMDTRAPIGLVPARSDVSRQYWTMAGGREWLAVEYEYTRRR
jgi:hypothetical protein